MLASNELLSSLLKYLLNNNNDDNKMKYLINNTVITFQIINELGMHPILTIDTMFYLSEYINYKIINEMKSISLLYIFNFPDIWYFNPLSLNVNLIL